MLPVGVLETVLLGDNQVRLDENFSSGIQALPKLSITVPDPSCPQLMYMLSEGVIGIGAGVGVGVGAGGGGMGQTPALMVSVVRRSIPPPRVGLPLATYALQASQSKMIPDPCRPCASGGKLIQEFPSNTSTTLRAGVLRTSPPAIMRR